MVNTEITKVDDKHVKELKKDLTKNGGIILYHWNSCGHCRNFMPVWDRVTSLLENYPSYKIEYDYMSQAPQYFGHINSFPRIIAYFNGHKYEYQGSRDHDSLSNFIQKTIPSSPSSSLSSSHHSSKKQSKTSKKTKK
jgi:hypothetical protein